MTRALVLRMCLLGVVGAVSLLVPATTPAQEPQPTQRVLRASAAWPINDFTLTDQHGQPFTRDRLTGHWTFVLFGDGACAAPCSDALRALDGLFGRIVGAKVGQTTQALFVLMEARPDWADRMRTRLAPFDQRFVAGVGERATVQNLVEDWRVGNAAPSPGEVPGSYSGSLLLVGPDGAVRAEYLPPFDVPLLTADYLKSRLRRGSP
jgi:protein SCO1